VILAMSIDRDRAFQKYVEERYKGKVHRMERLYRPNFTGIEVHITFRIPEGEADELEIYRRVNRVIEVIADGETNNVR
jgi:hypothetical protein